MPDTIAHAVSALSLVNSASSDFDLNPSTVLAADRKLRAAAVLAAIRPETETLILTKRSSALKHHPGQVAFPGGKQDETDASLEAAALREAHEEVGLNPEQVSIVGRLPQHETVTGFLVQPFIGIIKGHFQPAPEAGEVA